MAAEAAAWISSGIPLARKSSRNAFVIYLESPADVLERLRHRPNRDSWVIYSGDYSEKTLTVNFTQHERPYSISYPEVAFQAPTRTPLAAARNPSDDASQGPRRGVALLRPIWPHQVL